MNSIYAIHQNPGPLLYILPTEKDVNKAFKEKIMGMIELTPSLNNKIMHPKGRKFSVRCIKLRSMTLHAGWAGGLGSLSSTPFQFVILDEIRLMGNSTGKESNAVKLANDRMKSYKKFGRSQAYGVTTPSEEYDLMYNQIKTPNTTQYWFMIKCASCDKYYIPNFFKNVKYDKGADECICLCPYCKNKQPEEDNLKRDFNKGSAYGIYEQQGSTDLSHILKDRRVVFRFNTLVSPFTSLSTIYREYESTKDRVDDYKNFWQCWLGLFWKHRTSKMDEESLKKRIKKGFKKGTVPPDVKFLTAGVDVQDVGFYVTVCGWAENKVCYIIDQYIIDCHKDRTNVAKTEEVLNNRLANKVWDKWEIACFAIDIADGDRFHEVVDATASMDKCFRVYGNESDRQVTTIKYYNTYDYYRVKASVYLEETDGSKNLVLPEDIEQDYITQFSNSKKVITTDKRGNSVTTWVKEGQNDYRMATVYAWECLDLPFNTFTLRDKLDDSTFSLNPRIKIEVATEDLIDENEDYEYFEDEGWFNV